MASHFHYLLTLDHLAHVPLCAFALTTEGLKSLQSPVASPPLGSPLLHIGAQEKAGVKGWSWEVAVRGTLKPWLPLLLRYPVRGPDPGCGGTFTGFSIHFGDQ